MYKKAWRAELLSPDRKVHIENAKPSPNLLISKIYPYK